MIDSHEPARVSSGIAMVDIQTTPLPLNIISTNATSGKVVKKKTTNIGTSRKKLAPYVKVQRSFNGSDECTQDNNATAISETTTSNSPSNTVNRKRQHSKKNSNETQPRKGVGSILRYFGGKNPAIKVLNQYIPENVTTLCSPFTGGSSIELHCAINRNIRVYAYDILDVLINFWQCLKENPSKLVEEIHKLRPLSKEAFYNLRDNILGVRNSNNASHQVGEGDSNQVLDLNKFAKAAAYFAVNRSSFSGGGLSAGYSKEAAEKRFTLSSIEKLLQVNLDNIGFECLDFEQSIAQHPDAFLICDPPYRLSGSGNTLYGRKGDLHKGFDHQRLFNILKTRSNWLLCYNDSMEIRELYRDYRIEKVQWAYSMSKDKASREIVILSQPSLIQTGNEE
jgi:DNA adenine methylase